jgi:hypothetical protein
MNEKSQNDSQESESACGNPDLSLKRHHSLSPFKGQSRGFPGVHSALDDADRVYAGFFKLTCGLPRAISTLAHQINWFTRSKVRDLLAIKVREWQESCAGCVCLGKFSWRPDIDKQTFGKASELVNPNHLHLSPYIAI